MPDFLSRRSFLKKSSLLAVGASAVGGTLRAASVTNEPLFKISLAEWSLNGPLFAGRINHLEFPRIAADLGIDGVEYVNQFFMDRAEDRAYLREMKKRADGEGVRSVLIMCDREGRLGDPDEAARIEAVENHYKWVEAAKSLGCHSIRVNGYSEGSYEEQVRLVADGFSRLVEFADDHDINVMIENHGGFSSNANWVVDVMETADHPRIGTLPDFGNFRIDDDETYDSYRGTEQMMAFAKGVSVKPMGYDADGTRHELDLHRMMRIVLDAGYRGFCGIEYGPDDAEIDGIKELRDALVAVRDDLSPAYLSS
ncbi:MAG: sugar phosphate isomerase/epimerase family protein [Rhodothermales bacterium]